MARKEVDVMVPFEGRDKGKVYHIKEMPASQAEWWATRVIQGVIAAGIEVPDYIRGGGMAGVAMLGMRAFGHLPKEELKDLLDEMFTCLSIARNPNTPELRVNLMEEDIEDVKTRLWLRDQIFELHTGFSFAAGKWTSEAANQTTNTSPTQMSPSASAQ